MLGAATNYFYFNLTVCCLSSSKIELTKAEPDDFILSGGIFFEENSRDQKHEMNIEVIVSS